MRTLNGTVSRTVIGGFFIHAYIHVDLHDLKAPDVPGSPSVTQTSRSQRRLSQLRTAWTLGPKLPQEPEGGGHEGFQLSSPSARAGSALSPASAMAAPTLLN